MESERATQRRRQFLSLSQCWIEQSVSLQFSHYIGHVCIFMYVSVFGCVLWQVMTEPLASNKGFS